MEYSELIARIVAVIKENGNKEITGDQLQGVLFDMVGNLGSGYQFGGIVTPLSNPGRPDAKMLYLAFEAGEYEHLGGLTLNEGMGIFTFDSAWHLEVIEYTEREYIERAFEERVNKTTAQAEVDLKADELTPVVPPMVTGSARGILGRSAAARFLYRQTSSGSGAAWLRSIHGRTVSYNQLCDYLDTTKYIRLVGGATISASGNIISIDMSQQYAGYYQPIAIVQGHKYLAKFSYRTSVAGIALGYGVFNSSGVVGYRSTTINTGGSWQREEGVFIAGEYNSAWGFFCQSRQAGIIGLVEFNLSELVDLTQAGLDSIITTPEQFEAWQMEQFGHKGYLGYTPGTLVSVNPTGVKTTTPGGDEHTLPLDFTEHFPTGMNGANGIYDEVVSDENGKFTDGGKRLGMVDLGTLPWNKDANNDVFWAQVPEAVNFALKCMCPKYQFVGNVHPTVMLDQCLSNTNYYTTRTIAIKDSSIVATTREQIRAAMSGVPLVFELATPRHVTFTDPSDAVYPVIEGGTEQVQPVNGKIPTTISPDMTLQMPRILGKETPTMATLDNFLAAIGPKIGKTITKEWDNETHSYQFEIQ